MSKVIKSAGREIILKVLRYCEREKKNGSLTIPLNQVTYRVANMTGVSARTVHRISIEGKRAESTSQHIPTPGRKKKMPKARHIGEVERCMIRRKIHELRSEKNEVPTLKKLVQELRKEVDYRGSQEMLRRVLKNVGFRFKQHQKKRRVLLERYDIAAWRARYITTVRQHRILQDQHPVVYLAESKLSHLVDGVAIQESADGGATVKIDHACQNWFVIHAGCRYGFIDEALLMYKTDPKKGQENFKTNERNFKIWVKDQLIPHLPIGSTVVIDNVPHHCMQTDKSPTMLNKMAEMQGWLRLKKVEFQETMSKAELFELIKKNKGPKTYEVDELLMKHGHTVIRLPPYHSDLNPMEAMWRLIKTRALELKQKHPQKDSFKLVTEAINTVTPHEWNVECQNVIQLEDQYYERDLCLDHITDSSSLLIDSNTETETESDDLSTSENDHIDHTYF